MPEFGLATGDEQLVSPGEGRIPFLPASNHTERLPDLSFLGLLWVVLVEATAWPWSAVPGRTDDTTSPSSAPSEHSVDCPRTAPRDGVFYAVPQRRPPATWGYGHREGGHCT